MYGWAALEPEPVRVTALAAAGTASVTRPVASAAAVVPRTFRIFNRNDFPLSVGC